ncbi:MAG: DUF1549 domain-containing protein [Vicinamibacterales bacterium]
MRWLVGLTLLGWVAVAIAVGAGRTEPPDRTGEPRQTALPQRTPVGTPSTTTAARVGYVDAVAPILQDSCLDCHSQDKRKGGLSLASYADVLEGGKDGPIVRPGNSAGSMLLQRVMGEGGDQMPKDAAPLSTAQIAILRRWIDEGARATPVSAPAPSPWEPALALVRPNPPPMVWRSWSSSPDRIVASYLRAHRMPEPPLVSDAVFARRAFLDLWGLLPTPAELETFQNDRSSDKRRVLIDRLLGDADKYADHWISFWNDLLRNDDGVSYYSETGSRRSITPWLLEALRSNLPYDRFVSTLLNPEVGAAAEGFLVGVNWRGETSAAVTPWMQAAQNSAQVFLGVNLKCNACHDSFISKWKLKDAYGLASFFSPDGRLQLYRCDIAQEAFAEPAFLYPELNRTPATTALSDRRAAVAAIFTDPRNGRLARTVTNRVWQRLMGYGIVANPDDMDGRPWSPALLDWLAADLAEHGYDLKHLIATIVGSRAYQIPTVARDREPAPRDYVFAGPEVRRLSAEQFADAVGSITGEWGISTLNIAGTAAPGPAGPGRGAGAPTLAPGVGAARGAGPALTPSDPLRVGRYVRAWKMPSNNLSRALGRPVRDQVTSVRATQPTTPQGLELVNGESLTHWLSIGARRLLNQQRAEPTSLYNKSVSGRQARPAVFDVDVSGARMLWLIVQENGSNDPARVLPVWARAELVDAAGVVTPLSALSPRDSKGLRAGSGPVAIGAATADEVVRVSNPSMLVYDIGGRGFTRLRGVMWLENPVSDIGATLDPQTRFYVFGEEPNLERLQPPMAGAPLPAPLAVKTEGEAVDGVFRHALGRRPTAGERQVAEAALRDPARPGGVSPDGLANLLWAVLMKPEFQLIY